MARKSRYLVEDGAGNGVHNEGKEKKQGVFAAIYARKSLEDDSSLETQIAMLEDYINDSDDLVLYQVYADNGFSGVTFDRPAFLRMNEDMKAGKFQAIVVKDGSRLGRNYLEAGAYMENIFPSYGIRFISVNDHYDSADVKCVEDGISVPLRNIMNEQYSKDLSRKLSSAFRAKQLAGEYIGGIVSYGYKKKEGNGSRLVVDEEVAATVVRIFRMKAEGFSDGKIAQVLNEEGVLSPYAYRYDKGIVKAEKYKGMPWKKGTISQMLTKQIYLGHMVQGIRRQSLSRREKAHNTKENEWIVVKDTHEAIVSEELFEAVQLILSERNKRYKKAVEVESNIRKEQTVNLFKKKIYCADCGRAMVVGISRTKRANHFYYRCRTSNETNGFKCEQRSVNQKVVEDAVFEMIQAHIKLFADSSRKIKKRNGTEQAKRRKEKLKGQICQLESEKMHYSELAAGLYRDYVERLLDNEEYVYASKEYKGKIADLDARLSLLKEQVAGLGESFVVSREWEGKVDLFGREKVLSQELVDAFVKRIDVCLDGQLVIRLNCMDEFQEALRLAR